MRSVRCIAWGRTVKRGVCKEILRDLQGRGLKTQNMFNKKIYYGGGHRPRLRDGKKYQWGKKKRTGRAIAIKVELKKEGEYGCLRPSTGVVPTQPMLTKRKALYPIQHQVGGSPQQPDNCEKNSVAAPSMKIA